MILLDTHVVLWLLADRDQLSPAAIRALTQARAANDGIAVSDMCLWELAMLATRGKIEYPRPLHELLWQVEQGFVVLPVNGRIAEQAQQFSPRYPKDPVDRILGATALAHGISLVTRDLRIRQSGEVECIW